MWFSSLTQSEIPVRANTDIDLPTTHCTVTIREDFTKLTQLTLNTENLYEKLLCVNYINDGFGD